MLPITCKDLEIFVSESAKIQLTDSLIYQYFLTYTLLTATVIWKRIGSELKFSRNLAVRFILKLRRFDHVTSEINMLSMDEMFRMFSSCVVYNHKDLPHYKPSNLSERLSFWAEVFRINGCHGGVNHFPKLPKTEIEEIFLILAPNSIAKSQVVPKRGFQSIVLNVNWGPYLFFLSNNSFLITMTKINRLKVYWRSW